MASAAAAAHVKEPAPAAKAAAMGVGSPLSAGSGDGAAATPSKGGKKQVKLDVPRLLSLSTELRSELFRLADTVSHNPDKARDDILHRWSPALRQAMHNRSSSVIPAAQYLRSHRQQHSDAALVADIDKRTTDVMINIINRTLTPERGFYDLVFFPLTDAGAVRLLLSRGVDPNTVFERGHRALHLAAIKGDIPTATTLIEYGADVNAQDAAGQTALHYACAFNFSELAELLVRCGAILTIKNRSGHTAFQAGAAMGYIELAKKLDRAVPIREEVYLRVKRFYIHVMEGDPVYWRDVDDEEQPAEFIVGRMLAAIVIFRPRFFTGSRVKRKLIPADLVDIKRLGIKAFGRKKWEQSQYFDYTNPKLALHVARRVFRGAISTAQAARMLMDGKHRYEKRLADEAAAEKERLRREAYYKFIKWYRNPNKRHRKAIYRNLWEAWKTSTPVCQCRVEEILDRDTEMPVEEWDGLFGEDREVFQYMWKVMEEHDGRLLNQKPAPAQAHSVRSLPATESRRTMTTTAGTPTHSAGNQGSSGTRRGAGASTAVSSPSSTHSKTSKTSRGGASSAAAPSSNK